VNSERQQALSEYLLALADDELILGHRNSEWCGHAPILEEDIAFANIALDELGHASVWYGLMAELAGEDPDTYPDRLVYFRDAAEFRNTRLVELPKGDWAFSMLRQYLFDAYEYVRLEALASSQYQPLAEAAAKIRKEELYHYRHTRAWIHRLGLGTAESCGRLQKALGSLWPDALQLFYPLPDEAALVSAGFVPEAAAMERTWVEEVTPFLKESGIVLDHSQPQKANAEAGSGRDRHTPHLKVLVAELQSVARLEPEAGW
jgi:ring-1,2-phenylacetyl-CoA epoxidase subunit PaaC